MKLPIDIGIGLGSSGGVVAASQTSGGTSGSNANMIDQQTAGARHGFYFRATASGNVATLDFRMWREGGLSTGTYALELRNYTSGGTVGSLVATVNIDPAGLTTVAPGDAVTASYSSAPITSGNDYCFIFDESGLTGNGLYRLDYLSPATTSNNFGKLNSSDSGANWSETDNLEPYFVVTLE